MKLNSFVPISASHDILIIKSIKWEVFIYYSCKSPLGHDKMQVVVYDKILN